MVAQAVSRSGQRRARVERGKVGWGVWVLEWRSMCGPFEKSCNVGPCSRDGWLGVCVNSEVVVGGPGVGVLVVDDEGGVCGVEGGFDG